MSNLQKAYELYKPFKGKMLGVFAFIFASQALGLIAPLLQGRIIDVIAVKGFKERDAYQLALIAAGIMYLRNVVIMYWREKYEIRYIDFPIPRHLDNLSLERLLGFSLGQHISENSGLKQSVIARGKQALTNAAPTVLYSILPTFSEVVIMLAALMYLCLPLGLASLAGVCLFSVVVVYTENKLEPELKRLEKMYNETSNFRGEVIKNIDLVITNAQEERALRECDEKVLQVQESQKQIWDKYLRLTVVRNHILDGTRLAISLLGIHYIYQGRFTVGTLVVFWSWSNNALANVGMIGRLQRTFMHQVASIKKYFAMMDMETDVPVAPNPIRLEPFHGDIEFKNVTLSYLRRDIKLDDEEPVKKTEEKKQKGPALDDISFSIPAGARVAIVGESGAGKSTLVHALRRGQDPDKGQILIDGHDLRLLDFKQYRRSVGYVSQEISLFDQSIKYNIAYGLEDQEISPETLETVTKMSCIDRFYPRLENGYDTVIGEKGVKLSGGEKQRVGIARALVKNPRILIFDEATSSLDSENENLIRQSIEAASVGRTTIIIAHRWSTIRNVDQILVLEKGKLVGQGTHEALRVTCPEYQRLIQHQAFV